MRGRSRPGKPNPAAYTVARSRLRHRAFPPAHGREKKPARAGFFPGADFLYFLVSAGLVVSAGGVAAGDAGGVAEVSAGFEASALGVAGAAEVSAGFGASTLGAGVGAG